MINYFSKKFVTILVLFLLGLQFLIYLYNQKPSYVNFSKKNITVENFSSIVLSNSGITKIGSEKLNLIGDSFLENNEYKIYGKNISINMLEEISYSNNPVEVINSMGVLKAKGFKNLDYESKILFTGEVEFLINE